MKKTLTIFSLSAIFALSSQAQTEIWKMQDYSIGENVAGFPGGLDNSIPTMAEVIMLPDSTFRMYVNTQWNMGEKHCISYAESPDAITWGPVDTCFCGSADTTARNYVVGGASIVKTTSGQYRMYYRATSKIPMGGFPEYHIRSAISSDGLIFTQEGIRIDIQPYDMSSDFVLAGHGSFYKLSGDSCAAIFSGNPDTSLISQPSSLIHATSPDGLVWGDFTFLYQNHHDPVVIKKNGKYIMYGMDLHYFMAKAISTNGIDWPSDTDSASFLDTSDDPMIVDGTKKIGDVGGIVMPDNEVFLYTNYGTTTGPSLDIIRYTLQNPGVEIIESDDSELSLFPNPCTAELNIVLSPEFADDLVSVEVLDLTGRNVCAWRDIANTGNFSLDVREIPTGTYLVKFTGSDGATAMARISISR
jgi:hypothetical protein